MKNIKVPWQSSAAVIELLIYNFKKNTKSLCLNARQ